MPTSSRRRLALIAAALALLASPAAAQPPRVQTPAEALADDAAQYARHNAVAPDEALRRLRAQEESVSATDGIADTFRQRLAGIAIDHQPSYRVVVLLTGSQPVPAQTIVTAGMAVPVIFRTGARATRDQIVAAMRRHGDTIRAALPDSEGMGLDSRTGELVVLGQPTGLDADAATNLHRALETLTGVPVRIGIASGETVNFDIAGGSRVEGVDPADGRRYWCTTGFVVTDGARTGVVTAAHCPDRLTYHDPDGREAPLEFIGGWGAKTQDVQVHVSPEALAPYFYADRAGGVARPVTGARPRASTRAGDAVCHRGESSGYGCAQVQLTDFAPPGELCGGPCDPVWVTVAGPSCRGGDSGGPIFNGTTAFGIVKGGNWSREGRCNYYYYMSTDYLPEGWRLLTEVGPTVAPSTAANGISAASVDDLRSPIGALRPSP